MKSLGKLLVIVVSFVSGMRPAQAQFTDAQIRALVIKNITAYHFRYADLADLEISRDNKIIGKDMFFNDFWPDANDQLEVQIEKSALKYPDSKYQLFQVNKVDYHFSDPNSDLSYIRYLPSFNFDELYLIAVSEDRRSLKFISGNFFKSQITSDFNIDITDPETMIPYLTLYFFNTGITDIKYNKAKSNVLMFSARINAFHKNAVISVNKNDLVCKLTQVK